MPVSWVALTVSIGVAVQHVPDAPEPGADPVLLPSVSSAEELLLEADTALRQAKLQGGNGAVVFAPDMRDQDRDRMSLNAALHRAVTEKVITLAYQPVVSLPGGTLVAVEALASRFRAAMGLGCFDHGERCSELEG